MAAQAAAELQADAAGLRNGSRRPAAMADILDDLGLTKGDIDAMPGVLED
jgi:hypothetical protein